jgi:hypothetical protein
MVAVPGRLQIRGIKYLLIEIGVDAYGVANFHREFLFAAHGVVI